MYLSAGFRRYSRLPRDGQVPWLAFASPLGSLTSRPLVFDASWRVDVEPTRLGVDSSTLVFDCCADAGFTGFCRACLRLGHANGVAASLKPCSDLALLLRI
jgi:hypothetical protein